MRMNSVIKLSFPLLLALASLASAQDELPRQAEVFEVAGGKAFLYSAPHPAAGRPWLWYAPTLNGVSIVQRKMYFEAFMKAGISTRSGVASGVAGGGSPDMGGVSADGSKPYNRRYDAKNTKPDSCSLKEQTGCPPARA